MHHMWCMHVSIHWCMNSLIQNASIIHVCIHACIHRCMNLCMHKSDKTNIYSLLLSFLKRLKLAKNQDLSLFQLKKNLFKLPSINSKFMCFAKAQTSSTRKLHADHHQPHGLSKICSFQYLFTSAKKKNMWDPLVSFCIRMSHKFSFILVVRCLVVVVTFNWNLIRRWYPARIISAIFLVFFRFAVFFFFLLSVLSSQFLKIEIKRRAVTTSVWCQIS